MSKLENTPTETKLNQLMVEFQELLKYEYERGAIASIQNIRSVLESGSASVTGLAGTRVPNGFARPFIEKVLAGSPLTISEMQSSAKTELEKRLSYQTIRLELLRGAKQKRYRKLAGGKWLLLRD